MGTIQCIIDRLRTREHAENLNGKDAYCEPAFLGWVGWERRQRFRVSVEEDPDPKVPALLKSGNLMVLMEGDRYDIYLDPQWSVTNVLKVTFREMFRFGANGASELDDVHWKSRPKSYDLCAIWSIAVLDLSLWAVRWKASESHGRHAKRGREKYGRDSREDQAPVTCNDNSPPGYIVGTDDDPSFSDVRRRQVPGYSGDASYSYWPWHCPALANITPVDLVRWLIFLERQIRGYYPEFRLGWVLDRAVRTMSAEPGGRQGLSRASMRPDRLSAIGETPGLSPVRPGSVRSMGGRDWSVKASGHGSVGSNLVIPSASLDSRVAACDCGAGGCDCGPSMALTSQGGAR